jgi:hypothetical protein
MTVTLHPLGANLLLRIEPEPEPSAVIAVQRRTEGLARFGTVTDIGPEVREVQVGQRILASITAGVELERGVVMIHEDAVLGLCQP